jgi:deoxyadenosine/deoxycytidine kinase
VKDSQNETILSKFYKNPAKHAFAFQVMAFSTRLTILREAIQQNPDVEIILCERSLDADKEIFAKMLYDDGVIEDTDYQIYNMFYNEITKQPEVKQLSGVIYINADPEVSFERTKIRARDSESTITLGYLKECHAYHEKWIGDKKQADLNYPVLNINANGLISEEQINSIFEFIHRFQ